MVCTCLLQFGFPDVFQGVFSKHVDDMSVSREPRSVIPNNIVSASACVVSCLLILLQGCAEKRGGSYETLQVTNASFEGVIFINPDWQVANALSHPHVQGFWVPATNDVYLAESRIRKYLATELRKKDILSALPMYKRQYFGLVENGKKLVVCSFVVPNGRDVDIWRTVPVVYPWGGRTYFSVDYYVAEDSCYHFTMEQE